MEYYAAFTKKINNKISLDIDVSGECYTEWNEPEWEA